jgi:hypothetical protein
MIEAAARELRFALRLPRRSPAFTAGAVVPLAFAIGCTACALTLADAFFYRPIGIHDPSRMTAVYAYSRQRSAYLSSSYPDLGDLQSLAGLVESAAAFVRIPVNVRGPEGAERMNSELGL